MIKACFLRILKYTTAPDRGSDAETGLQRRKQKGEEMNRKSVSRNAISFLVSLFLILSAALAIGGLTSYGKTTSTVDGTKYTHLSRYQSSRYKVFDGIDVSWWQYTNNWKKIKNDGVDFAIIRCGYTAMNGSFKMVEDSTFETNLVNAANNGVNVGVYYYSLATNQSEAAKEANFVVSLLKKYEDRYGIRVNLPVVMDDEFTNGDRAGAAYNNAKASNGVAYARAKMTNIAVKWLDTVEAAGYTPMFYSYRNMVDPSFNSGYKFNMSKINGSNQYPFWLAQYSTTNAYSGNVTMWQYTSSGSVNGTGSSRTDRNFYYYDTNGSGTKSGTKSIRNCSIQLAYSEMKYDGDPKEPYVTVKDGDQVLTKNKDYTVAYFNNRKKGTANVVIQGIGDYSNDILKTFTVGTENRSDGGGGTTITPDTPNSWSTSLDAARDALTVRWNPSANATDYTVAYRVNRGSWNTVSTNQTNYVLELDENDLVDVKVRAENRSSGTSYSSSYTTEKHRFIGDEDASTSLSMKTKVMTLSLPKQTAGVSSAQLNYDVKISTDGGAYKTRTATGNSLPISVSSGKRYAVKLCPVPTVDGTRYVGGYGSTSRRYAVQNTIRTVSGYDGKALVTFDHQDGTGVQLNYAAKSSMSGSKTKNLSASATSATVTGLGTGSTYYFRVRTNKVAGRYTFLGAYSTKKSVKPLQITPGKVGKVTVSVNEASRTIGLSFKAVPLASNYEVAYKLNDEDTWRKEITGGKTTWKITTPEAGDTVAIRVRALKTVSAGIGGYSVSGTYYGPYTGIYYRWVKKMSLENVTPLSAGFRVTPSDIGQSSYKVYYSPYGSLSGRKILQQTGTKTLSVKSLPKKQTYYLKSRAILTKDGHDYYGQYCPVTSVITK